MYLYLTADRVGMQSGGGIVTAQEAQAFAEFSGPSGYRVITIDHSNPPTDPFQQDQEILRKVKDAKWSMGDLAHCYAGCLSETVKYLKSQGVKVTYTAAAHDVELSREEHEKLGIPFDYPHLIHPDKWSRYLEGYLLADVLICPSYHSAEVMRRFGYKGQIKIIPHGCHLPDKIAPLPSLFTVGYLGAVGPDKGLVYLLQAWKQLAYKDAILVIAGPQSTIPFVQNLVSRFGGGHILLRGWIDDVADFYNNISLYVQASVTEGFGIEVLEAMAHGRAVLCSRGAGAAEVLPGSWYAFSPKHIGELAGKIDQVRLRGDCQPERNRPIHNGYPHWERIASSYEWSRIRQQYVALWRSLQ